MTGLGLQTQTLISNKPCVASVSQCHFLDLTVPRLTECILARGTPALVASWFLAR